MLLETLALSVLNHDSAIASAAARMVAAACERPCIEMGSRRTHEQAAVAAARAAYLVGFAATSNLEAGRRYGVPTAGTSAHAFTLLHDDEAAAFRAQVRRARHRHDAAGRHLRRRPGHPDRGRGRRPRARRASGSTPATCRRWPRRARELLDELGATSTRIVVTSDLDEYAIAGLQAAPVDGYGVGTSLVTGSGAPTVGMVYKLVERDGVPVAKKSEGKRSVGGRKSRRPPARRRRDGDGGGGQQPADRAPGTATATCSCRWCGAARSCARLDPPRRWPRPAAHHARVRAALPPEAWALSRGEPVLRDGDG